jgi:hypothetical protein
MLLVPALQVLLQLPLTTATIKCSSYAGYGTLPLLLEKHCWVAAL